MTRKLLGYRIKMTTTETPDFLKSETAELKIDSEFGCRRITFQINKQAGLEI